MRYKNICKAIIKEAKDKNLDFRSIMREWIMLFEATRVVGWNRDEFLECMIKCKKEEKK